MTRSTRGTPPTRLTLAALLVAAAASPTVSAMAARAGGADEAAVLFPVAQLYVPHDIWDAKLGDVDGDGHLDLVAWVETPLDRVFVALGKGNGWFERASLYETLPDVGALALADVNGDGHLDVLTAFGTELGVQLGDGSGAFPPPLTQTITSAQDLVVAELTGDGRDDLVVLGSAGDTRSYAGQADGSLLEVDAFTAAGNHAVLADLDDDGLLDLVSASSSFGSSDIYVALGAGGGTFTELPPFGSLAGGSAMLTVDVDGDDVLDLFTYGQQIPARYLGVGDGTFTSAANIQGAFGVDAAFPILADDADTLVDVITFGGNGVDYSVNLGVLGLVSLREYMEGDFTGATSGDLDDDGVVDYVGWDVFDDAFTILRGKPTGTEFDDTVPVESGRQTALADVDGDGGADLLTNGASGQLDVALADGSGGFGRPGVVGLPGDDVRAIRAGDVDGDGFADALVELTTNPQRVDVLRGAVGGVPVVTDSVSITGALMQAAFGDVDGDQQTDLVIGWNSGVGAVTIALGDGAGDFTVVHETTTPQPVRGLAVGDLDGDGLDDVVLGDGEQESLSVALASGGGFLAPFATQATPGFEPGLLDLADVTGDGALDVVALWADSPELDVLVAEGDGAGGLGALTTHDIGPEVSHLALADLDQDGALDVAAANRNGTRLMLNDGTGRFTTEVGVGGFEFTGEVHVGDVDGDGALDLLMTRDSSSAYSQVFLSRLEDAWTDLGGGTSGSVGDPTLVGTGTLFEGAPTSLELSGAPPGALMLAWIAFASVPFPALGGTVHASPAANQLLFVADGGGGFGATVPWPEDVPAGTQVWFQFVVEDPGVLFGLTLSNGVVATAP